MSEMENPILEAMANPLTERSLTGRSFGRLEMPVLETVRLVLREFQQADLQYVSQWQRDVGVFYTDVEANDFLSFCFREYVKWGIGPWGMVLKGTRRAVGSCGFCHMDPDRSSGAVNYYVAPQNRKQGLASEALSAILEFGFEGLGLSRIEARCATGNLSSQRVAQKAGMTFERILPADEVAEGVGSADGKLYKMDKEDFKPKKRPRLC